MIFIAIAIMIYEMLHISISVKFNSYVMLIKKVIQRVAKQLVESHDFVSIAYNFILTLTFSHSKKISLCCHSEPCCVRCNATRFHATFQRCSEWHKKVWNLGVKRWTAKYPFSYWDATPLCGSAWQYSMNCYEEQYVEMPRHFVALHDIKTSIYFILFVECVTILNINM